ncbi:hypothetical protein M747DRAFT_33170 [Aspergillus niger ATCC 13496]|nr:hypothetical protein M747DRAFT_33170 [Aspergillus niger ATCC 13496]
MNYEVTKQQKQWNGMEWEGCVAGITDTCLVLCCVVLLFVRALCELRVFQMVTSSVHSLD